jgi:hypothetical protein
VQRYRIYSREEISYRYCLKSLYIRIINRKIKIRIATAVVVSTILAAAAAVGVFGPSRTAFARHGFDGGWGVGGRSCGYAGSSVTGGGDGVGLSQFTTIECRLYIVASVPASSSAASMAAAVAFSEFLSGMNLMLIFYFFFNLLLLLHNR